MVSKIFLVMLGGSVGALSRYVLSSLALLLFGSRFAWGTLLVNLLGCFLVGILFAFFERGNHDQIPHLRLLFMTGFLGSLTTFSTFALETVHTFYTRSALLALANVLAHNVLGIALVMAGMWLVYRYF